MAKSKKQTTNTNPISRRFCFTVYPENLPDICFPALEPEQKNKQNGTFYAFHLDKKITTDTLSVPGTRGIIWSLEEGDSKEHIHIQGYCELSKPMRLFRFTRLLAFCKAHTEKAIADRSANFAYIMHEEKHKDKGKIYFYHQDGTWPESGGYESNICDEAVRMIIDGHKVTEVLSLFGGSLLWAVGNLAKLQHARQEELYEEEFLKDQWKRRHVFMTGEIDERVAF